MCQRRRRRRRRRDVWRREGGRVTFLRHAQGRSLPTGGELIIEVIQFNVGNEYFSVLHFVASFFFSPLSGPLLFMKKDWFILLFNQSTKKLFVCIILKRFPEYFSYFNFSDVAFLKTWSSGLYCTIIAYFLISAIDFTFLSYFIHSVLCPGDFRMSALFLYQNLNIIPVIEVR